MFNTSDISKNSYMLEGSLARKGYDWWWHSFTGIDEETGEEKSFFVEFFIINPKKSINRPMFGSWKEEPSYLMVKAGCWGKDHVELNRFFPLSCVHIASGAPFSIGAADCFCSEDRLRGSVMISDDDVNMHPEYMSGSGSMSWKLKIKKEIAFNVGYGTSFLFRKIKAFEMYWHAEGMKTSYEGEVFFNGRRYIVNKENCYGYADKNWGRDFTSPWIWLSSNDLYSKKYNKKLENSVFDIGGGRPKVYFIPFNKKLLGAIYYEGREFEYNFSKFWHKSKITFDCKVLNDRVVWNIVLENKKTKAIVNVECLKDGMLLNNYEAPDGVQRHKNLYNGGTGYGTIKLYEKNKNNLTLIDEIECKHVGCEYGEYDEEKK